MFGLEIRRARREPRVLHVPPMPERRLLECFRSAEESELLRGVLYLLRRLGESARADAGVLRQADALTLKAAARQAAFNEAEEELLEMCATARKAFVSERPRNSAATGQTTERAAPPARPAVRP